MTTDADTAYDKATKAMTTDGTVRWEQLMAAQVIATFAMAGAIEALTEQLQQSTGDMVASLDKTVTIEGRVDVA